MKPIQLPLLTDQQLDELNELYRKTRDPRQRTRAQIILLAAEKELVAEAIGAIVRLSDQAVRKWLKRYMAEGIKGLNDMPRAGSPLVKSRRGIWKNWKLPFVAVRAALICHFRCGRFSG
jgi:hypothetical protein